MSEQRTQLGTDRERRAELEQLQTELRDARAVLAKPEEDNPLIALEQKLAEARSRNATAGRRKIELEAELLRVKAQLPQLKQAIEEQSAQSGRRRIVGGAAARTPPDHTSALRVLLGLCVAYAIIVGLLMCAK